MSLSRVMVDSWLVALAVVSVGAVFFLSGRKKRRPTQHDLDPTLKKNQIRIATQKKAFRREDLPPEYLASLQRRDIVELPMGAPRPEPPSGPPPAEEAAAQRDVAWLPDHLQQDAGRKNRRKPGK